LHCLSAVSLARCVKLSYSSFDANCWVSGDLGPVVGEQIRILVRAEVSEAVTMKMTGHKTRSIFDRYDIVTQGDLNDAVRQLDEHMVTKTVMVPNPENQVVAQAVER
jgi:hypothetical protein